MGACFTSLVFSKLWSLQLLSSVRQRTKQLTKVNWHLNFCVTTAFRCDRQEQTDHCDSYHHICVSGCDLVEIREVGLKLMDGCQRMADLGRMEAALSELARASHSWPENGCCPRY